jgi:hypothetical protein
VFAAEPNFKEQNSVSVPFVGSDACVKPNVKQTQNCSFTKTGSKTQYVKCNQSNVYINGQVFQFRERSKLHKDEEMSANVFILSAPNYLSNSLQFEQKEFE